MTNNNSVSFGSTKILYSSAKVPITKYLDKIKQYPNHRFGDIKGYIDFEYAAKNLKPRQVALIAEKDALFIKGQNKKEDKLIYNILTNFGKSKDEGISYVNDTLNVIA